MISEKLLGSGTGYGGELPGATAMIPAFVRQVLFIAESQAGSLSVSK